MKLAYVLSRFPLLSETFILREMLELERTGHQLTIFPLRRVRTGPQHGGVRALRARVHWTPWLGRWRGPGEHGRRPATHPRQYCGTLAAVLWHNRGDRKLLAGALAYWPKAVAITHQMQREGIERVHAHYATHAALVAYVAEQLAGIPYSFTAHAHDLYCHRAMLGKKLERARLAVTISDFNRHYLERANPAAANRIQVIRCGVETRRYADVSTQKRRGAPANKPLRLLSVGSLQPYKGHVHLLAACRELRDSNCALDCRIVGGGRLEKTLRGRIVRLRLDDCVRLEGPQPEDRVRTWLEWAHVFVLPSVVDARTGQMEGIPVALMEAMAAGLPVVASRLSGIPELVGTEAGREEGILVTPGDARELAAAIWRLRDPDLRQRLGAAAQRQVRAQYELEANVRRLAEALAETQTSPGAAA